MLISAAALEAVAVALLVGAFVSRTDAEQFEGKSGTIEELLDQFSTPADRKFTAAGTAMLTLAAVAALLGSVLLLGALRRR
jgi:hypothetical protein